MRALVVSNMLADTAHPERGRFVRDQVAALRALDMTSPPTTQDPPVTASGREPQGPRGSLEPPGATSRGVGLQVELFELAPGPRSMLAAVRELRRRYRGERFDVVHAHFGLSAYPALAVRARVRGVTLHGSDVDHPRTRLLTAALLPAMDLLGAVSPQLVSRIPGRRARARARVLPCGVDLERFKPLDRARARQTLGLRQERPYLLLPADPARAEKRHDRALALAESLDAELLTLGGVPPERVPLHVNAADVVVIPSEREGFGLAALEALACDVPVLATPVGIHAQALQRVAGCLCAPFDLDRWRQAALAHLTSDDARIEGRPRAERFSSQRMAQKLAESWSSLIAADG